MGKPNARKDRGTVCQGANREGFDWLAMAWRQKAAYYLSEIQLPSFSTPRILTTYRLHMQSTRFMISWSRKFAKAIRSF